MKLNSICLAAKRKWHPVLGLYTCRIACARAHE